MPMRLFQVAGGRAADGGVSRSRFDARDLPLLSNLDARAVREFEDAAVGQTFRRRSLVFAQGDAASRLFVVVAGQIRLSRCSPEGREVSIGFAGPGETIGEEAALAERSYAWSATCCSVAHVLGLARTNLRRCLREDPSFAVNVANIFQRRLVQMARMLEYVAYDRVGTRLLELLKMLASEAGSVGADGTTFRLEFTHHDIAAVIASTRETVTSELANLVRSGQIRFQGRRVVTLLGFYLDDMRALKESGSQ